MREKGRRKGDNARGEAEGGGGSLNELNVCHPVVRHYSRLTGHVANPISNIFSSLRRISGSLLCCRSNGLHVVVGSARCARPVRFSVPWAGSSRSSIPISFADPRRHGRFVLSPGKFFSIFWPASRALGTRNGTPRRGRPVDLPDDS